MVATRRIFLRAGSSALDQCEIHIPPKVSLILLVEMMLDCQFCFNLVILMMTYHYAAVNMCRVTAVTLGKQKSVYMVWLGHQTIERVSIVFLNARIMPRIMPLLS